MTAFEKLAMCQAADVFALFACERQTAAKPPVGVLEDCMSTRTPEEKDILRWFAC